MKKNISYKSQRFLFVILLSWLTFSFNVNLYAQSAGGGYAESYLLRNVGGRPVAMAGTYAAIADEPSGIFYNPAGLSLLSDKPSVSTMYSFMEFGRTQQVIAWGQNFAEDFGLGFAFNNFTTGSFAARDVMGHQLGNYTDWQYSATAGASYKLEFISVGLAAKYLSNSLAGSNTKASGFAVDIGTKFNIADLFSFGLAVQNISGMMFWNTATKQTDALPYIVRTGFATVFNLNETNLETRTSTGGQPESVLVPSSRYVLVGLDAVLVQHENAPSVTLGLEVVPHEIIAFRGGIGLMGDDLGIYKFLPMTLWGFGISLRPDLKDYDLPFKINIDYSISSDYLSSNRIAHHLSLHFAL